MLRLLFWLLAIGGVLLALDGTLPVGLAREEVVYTTPPPVASCGPSGCIAVYALEVGNVGRSAQDGVRVRLRADALATPAILPTVRRAGATGLAAGTEERAGVETYALGPLEIEERVSLVFALRTASRDVVPGWDRVLVEVEPSAGSAHPGDAGALSTGRLVQAAGRVASRLTGAVRKAIASD
jgi:hypothetical protein